MSSDDLPGPRASGGYVPSDGMTRVERRRRSEQEARLAKGGRTAAPDTTRSHAADMARAATAIARSRRSPDERRPGTERRTHERRRTSDERRSRTRPAAVPRQRIRRSPAPDKSRPLYARVLRLHHLKPGVFACFLLFEGVLALAILLSLAELVNWLSVLVLPVVVAGLVKIHDIIGGAFARGDARRDPGRPPRARGVAKVRGIAAVLPRQAREPEVSGEIAAAPSGAGSVPALSGDPRATVDLQATFDSLNADPATADSASGDSGAADLDLSDAQTEGHDADGGESDDRESDGRESDGPESDDREAAADGRSGGHPADAPAVDPRTAGPDAAPWPTHRRPTGPAATSRRVTGPGSADARTTVDQQADPVAPDRHGTDAASAPEAAGGDSHPTQQVVRTSSAGTGRWRQSNQRSFPQELRRANPRRGWAATHRPGPAFGDPAA